MGQNFEKITISNTKDVEDLVHRFCISSHSLRTVPLSRDSSRQPVPPYGKIREAMEAFRDADVDRVICLGDLVDECDTMEENITAITELAEMIRSFGFPFDCVMGNHDYQNFTREEFREYTGFAPEGTIRCGTKTLIFLDTNYADNGNIYKRNEIDWTNAFLPPDQLRGLREVLAMPETEEAYVFLHQNLDPDVERHHIVRNAEEVRAVIRESGKVKAVFQGHYHPGHEAVIDGIPYHTLPAMCEGEENRFVIVEI